MLELDYTNQGRRPSVRQIISDWRKHGKPSEFEVTYGETYAHFVKTAYGHWFADGNGCRGVDRFGVEQVLNNGVN